MTEPRPYRGIADGKWVKGDLLTISKTYICSPNFVPVAIYYVTKPNGQQINVMSHLLTGLVEVIPKTVGQFTGLKDKNNKNDLYAGDRIVIGQDRGVLIWDEYEFAWAVQLDEDSEIQVICRFYTHEEIENIEYLGSIHDNLLKGAE